MTYREQILEKFNKDIAPTLCVSTGDYFKIQRAAKKAIDLAIASRLEVEKKNLTFMAEREKELTDRIAELEQLHGGELALVDIGREQERTNLVKAVEDVIKKEMEDW